VEKYLFVAKVLPLLEHQGTVRKVYSYFLRVLAGIGVIAGIVGFIELWKLNAGLSLHQVPGSVVFTILYILAVYMVIHLLWLRSETVMQLTDTDFSFTQLLELLLKIAGEIYLVYVAPLAIGGGFLLWFAGNDADYLLNRLVPFAYHSGSYGATGGFLYLVGTLFSSVIVYTLFMVFSELLVMVTEITMHTRTIRTIAEKK
jgi:hypothetical protein